MYCEIEGQRFISSLRNFVRLENRRAAQLRIEEGEDEEAEFNLIRDLQNLITCKPKRK